MTTPNNGGAVDVHVTFNGPDEWRAYADAPQCLRDLIYRQAEEIARLKAALQAPTP